jgi:uncharacterized membrane protein
VTTAEQPGRRPLHALAMLIGHYSTIVSPFGSLIIYATVIYRAVWMRPVNYFFAVITLVAMAVFVVALLLKDFYHGRQLCLRCLNAAPMLNPQAAVDRHINALRYVHFARVRAILLVALLIGSFTVSAGLLSGWPWPARAVLVAAATIGFVGVSYMDYASRMHQRLYPWCPWCKRRGFGGEPLPEPTPDPTIKASR